MNCYLNIMYAQRHALPAIFLHYVDNGFQVGLF